MTLTKVLNLLHIPLNNKEAISFLLMASNFSYPVLIIRQINQLHATLHQFHLKYLGPPTLEVNQLHL